MQKMSVKDIDVSSKNVLMRVDFNVPLDENNNVTDDTRIQASLPTIRYLLENNAKIILMSHLGRPKDSKDVKYKLDPVARKLEEILGKNIKKVDACVGPEVKETVKKLKDGEILLLENVRFYPEEKENNPDFACELSEMADIYVNDAFGTAHRSHATTVGVANYLPAVAGFLMEKEIEIMGKAFKNPERPGTVVIGGAKVADKINVLYNFIKKVDNIAIGGGMANTFLKAQGIDIGKSKIEEDKLKSARNILKKAKNEKVNIYLPVDVVVAKEVNSDAETQVVPIEKIPENMMVLDIGPQTAKEFAEIIRNSKTVIWNGPMGVFEYEAFAQGTKQIAEAVADVKTSIVGGGDSAAAVEKIGVADRITHVSTGGGASLKFFEGQELPGIEVLAEKE